MIFKKSGKQLKEKTFDEKNPVMVMVEEEAASGLQQQQAQATERQPQKPVYEVRKFFSSVAPLR